MAKEILKDAFEKYIKGTPYKTMVTNRKFFLCHLTNAVCSGVGVDKNIGRIYITSRVLKHLFDKKPAEEFFAIIDELHKIVKYPDEIYKNKKGKRGEFCLVKRINDTRYMCSVEISKVPFIASNSEESKLDLIESDSFVEEIQIVTAFRLRDSDYIKNYTLLWSWGNGAPHRNALDTPEGTTCAPQ